MENANNHVIHKSDARPIKFCLLLEGEEEDY
jgi:hypothetical protein